MPGRSGLAGYPALLTRVADSRPMKLLSKPAVGPVLLPVITLLVFFTAIFPASLSNYGVYQLVHALLLVTGLVIALPLADEGGLATSLGIAAGILFAFLELLADAIPGIAIRLRTSILGYDHYHAVGRTWGPTLLHDQQFGGAIVWFLAEIIDLPVLALLVVAWIRADEREAKIIDRQLDEQQAKQAAEAAQAREAEQRRRPSTGRRPVTLVRTCSGHGGRPTRGCSTSAGKQPCGGPRAGGMGINRDVRRSCRPAGLA